MADCRPRRCSLVLGLVLIAVAGIPRAGAQGLSGDETAAINNLLGAGVLGTALPAEPDRQSGEPDPAEPGDLDLPVCQRTKPGIDRDRYPANQPPAGRRRSVAVHGGTEHHLCSRDGSRRQHRQPQRAGSYAGRADPVHPAPPGAAPGNATGRLDRPSRLQVNVYDISDPSTVTHTGSLTLTVTYLGRYQVTVPAGTYPAALIKWQYNGQVGPATVSDVEYRFFADGVGPVAAIDKQRRLGLPRLQQRDQVRQSPHRQEPVGPARTGRR